MKKRTIALMLSVLAVMMLVGVGFATWVISSGDAKEKTGNLVVETVRDDRLNITVTPLDSSENAGDALNVNFTAPASATTGWLTGEGNLTEKKTLVFRVSVAREDGSAFTNVADVDFTAALKEGTTNNILLDGIIVEATNFISYGEKSIVSGAIQCDITVAYEWGALFGGVNPYTYFNTKDVDEPITAAEATAANAAGCKYKDADLVGGEGGNSYGDLANAILNKLYSHSGAQVVITLKVDLHVE